MTNRTEIIDMKEFWKRIEYLKEVNGLSTVDLQKRLGKNGTYLYVAKSHLALPNIDVLIGFAEIFHCSLDFLLGCNTWAANDPDPELQAFTERWNADPQFKALIKQLMAQLG